MRVIEKADITPIEPLLCSIQATAAEVKLLLRRAMASENGCARGRQPSPSTKH
jgi:hypothetical protein